MSAIECMRFSGSFFGTLVGAQGIDVHDEFSGAFSYDRSAPPVAASPDAATYQPTSFSVTLPNGLLVASNLSLRLSVDPQDPSLQLAGKLPFNLHVGLILRGPSGVITDTSLPRHIKLSAFLIKHLTISDQEAALFGVDQTGTPPPGVAVFVRGKLDSLKQDSFIISALCNGLPTA